MLKSELEELVEEQAARIAELEAGGPEVHGYLVFAGHGHTPGGGWRDYQQCFADEADAVARARTALADGCAWAQVVELPTGRVQEIDSSE
jgi:hypothetical protein